jgi:hypothetical protein
MPQIKSQDRVAIAPWHDWIVEQLESTTKAHLAQLLGCDESLVNRWVAGGYNDNGHWIAYTDISIGRVDELLSNTSTLLSELYPVNIELEADAYCERCHEIVTPIDGECPWCDGTVTAATGRQKRYCGQCDKLVTPANNGRCWRCGSTTDASVPWSQCACGCGTMKRSFDPQGRKVRYILGHAPRSLEKPTGTVPVEPFARYLEQQLKDLDVIGAIARIHGLSRDEIVAVLQRRDEHVDRDKVRRAVWAAGRGGTGKGLPMRPGAPGFFDLYPDDKRSRTCPGCGHGKAPHAELCRTCRRTKGRPVGNRRVASVSDDILTRAYQAYQADERLSLAATAARFLEHVPHSSAESLAAALSKGWRDRDWPVRGRSRRVLAAAAQSAQERS